MRDAIILTIVCIISGASLFIVHELVEERIKEIENYEMARLLNEIFPSANFRKENEIYFVYSRENGELEGYVTTAEGTGYGGKISILIGINKDGRVKRIKILSHRETPGLGSRIVEESFLSQFEGRSSVDIRLKRDGGEIDAISGATISSRAVVDAVRIKMQELSHLWGSA